MTLPRALDRAQTVLSRTFTATATIFRKSRVDDNAGGAVDTYAATATVACSFARYPVRPFEREQDPFVRVISMWTFVFALDIDIVPTDRIMLGTFAVGTDIASAGGRTFEVVDSAVGSLEIARRVICQEIT